MLRGPFEEQFGTFTMLTMAMLPFGCALGLRMTDRPVAWFPAIIITTTILIGAFAAARDANTDGRRRILVGTLAIFAGLFGVAYVVEPWTPAYDNTGFVGLVLGFGITGALVGLLSGFIAARGRTSSLGVTGIIGGVLATGVMGIVVGYFIGIPLFFVWTEDVFRHAPRALSREAVALIVCGAVAALFAAFHGAMVRGGSQRRARKG